MLKFWIAGLVVATGEAMVFVASHGDDVALAGVILIVLATWYLASRALLKRKSC